VLRKRNVLSSDEPSTTLDRAGRDCGDKVGTSGAEKDNNKSILCQLDKMVTRQDKVMTTDQTHAAHAAPATMPMMLHVVLSASPTQGQGQEQSGTGGGPEKAVVLAALFKTRRTCFKARPASY
jgi:hypothetical protein